MKRYTHLCSAVIICDFKFKRTENHNFTLTTNTSQDVEFFHSLIFLEIVLGTLVDLDLKRLAKFSETPYFDISLGKRECTEAQKSLGLQWPTAAVVVSTATMTRKMIRRPAQCVWNVTQKLKITYPAFCLVTTPCVTHASVCYCRTRYCRASSCCVQNADICIWWPAMVEY